MSTVDINKQINWDQSKTKMFWGEIAPTGHLVQIYENDDVFLDTLEGFADSGLKEGETVVIIATREHLRSLNDRLENSGYDLHKLQSTNQYIPLDANESLEKFMRAGWPSEELFMVTVRDLLVLARGEKNRKVRAYGEMVAILWEQGNQGATVQLEHLWHKFCTTESFCLFCAYPKSGFTQNAEASIDHICSTHTMLIGGLEKSKTEVFYRNSRRAKPAE